MNPEQSRRFHQLVLMGRIRLDIADALRGLIEDVRDAAFAQGERASATAFETWTTSDIPRIWQRRAARHAGEGEL